jgi:hypothetical protein
VTMGMIYILGLVRHPMVPAVMGHNPEETLDLFLSNNLRFRDIFHTIFLPFSGKWTVWQGFDGNWTHKGDWQYAYDFIITDENGQAFNGNGTDLDDYYCFNKPVLSPVRGQVVNVIDYLPSNPIGEADEYNRWGNLVIISDPRGFFVEMSHFAEKSITVKIGDWVEYGTVIGLCGNSGYSPQPHIHVQVQATGIVGDATLPFNFVSYLDGDEYHANNIPPEKDTVEPLYRDKRISNAVTFVLDDEIIYTISRGNKIIGELRMLVKMAPDSTFYFETNRGRLYFGKNENRFYFYKTTGSDPWLRMIFTALPGMPLCYREGMTWHDYIPQTVVSSPFIKTIKSILTVIFPKLAAQKVSLRWINETHIESIVSGKTSRVEIARDKGFASIEINGLTLNRKQ